MNRVRIIIIALCFLGVQHADAQWLGGFNSIDNQMQNSVIQQQQEHLMREQQRVERWNRETEAAWQRQVNELNRIQQPSLPPPNYITPYPYGH